MSGFFGAQGTSMAQIGLAAHDQRLNAMDFQPEAEFADIWAIAEGSYATNWWPGSTFMGDQDVDGASMLGQGQVWGAFDQAAGASSAFGFAGITRDQYGSPLPGCTVKLFRTADDVLLDTQVSDANGSFVMRTSYYPDQHYIYTRKSGSPDVQGISVNTLIGT